MMMRLEGKTALVTGARRGIGAEVARRFAEEGAAVAVNYHDTPGSSQQTERLVEAIRRLGGTAEAVEADVSNPDDVDRMVTTVEASLGSIDIVVLNAARSGRASWRDITPAEWDAVMAVNLRGAFVLSQRVLPQMIENGWGRLITVGSIMSVAGMGEKLPYVSSKAGLVGFTRSLSREVGVHAVTVNCVMPGAIRTEYELEEELDNPLEAERRVLSAQALKRRGTAADLGGVFTLLASDDGSFITGQTICVDGGWVHL